MWWQTADGRLIELLRKDFHTDAAYYQALLQLKGFKVQGQVQVPSLNRFYNT